MNGWDLHNAIDEAIGHLHVSLILLHEHGDSYCNGSEPERDSDELQPDGYDLTVAIKLIQDVCVALAAAAAADKTQQATS